MPPLPPDPSWHHDAIIYQLHVKAFRDSNRDGYGDFRGLLEKLDYIAELGVTAIWLLPFYPSPLKDDGYDIADYCGVHPSYGSLEDVVAFLDAAHARGLRVITELVINHTSDQHPWFQRARAARRRVRRSATSTCGATTRTSTPATRIIFTDTETSNWTWDPVAQQFYWHRFFSHQPDLNFDNPGRARGGARRDALLAPARRGRAPPRRDPLPRRARGDELREPPRDARRAARSCAPRSTRSSRTGSSSPRRTSGRPTCGRTSATATNATWRSTFR